MGGSSPQNINVTPNVRLKVIKMRGILRSKVMMRNVTAGSCRQDHTTDIAARTHPVTIQITVSAKQNLAVVVNLAINILRQAGRLTLLYCTRFVFASLHSFRICFIALVLFFLHALCKISTNNTINNTKGSHENRLAYDCPGNVIKLTSTLQYQYELTHFRNIY